MPIVDFFIVVVSMEETRFQIGRLFGEGTMNSKKTYIVVSVLFGLHEELKSWSPVRDMFHSEV